MKNDTVPFVALLISGVTLIYSMHVAFALTGNVLGNVKIVQLEPYGAIQFSHLRDFEFWRLFASQLVHVKQFHMLYNVTCLALLGLCLTRRLGNLKFLLLWFVSGAVGTLAGTLFVAPPWNLGTGASQAVLGIAGFGLFILRSGIESSRWLVFVLCLSLVPAFLLDFIYAGYPKPGHIVAVLIGAIAGAVHSGGFIKRKA